MARKSKLTEEQWEDIRKRVIAGESVRGLAAEYSKIIGGTISEAAIRQRIKTTTGGRVSVDSIKLAAQKSLQNDLSDPEIRPILESIGPKDWDLFHSHKSDLLEMTMHLNLAAKLSAQNAHKLAEMAQNHLSKVETDAELDADTRISINDAMMLQSCSNESSKQPMKLFEIATKQPPPLPEDKPLRIIGGLPDVPYE